MKQPPIISANDLPQAVLIVERWVRTHPAAVGAFTIASIAAIGVGQTYMTPHGPTPLTYAFPLAVCSYGLGLITGAVAAFAVSTLWLLDAMNHGLPQSEATFAFALRLFSNLVIVALATVAVAAARARERYLEGQQQLAKLRADLVSAFSHDLRSPLSAITGYAEMVRDGVRDPATTEILDRILANANHLNHLIGDMLAAGDNEHAAPLDVSTFSVEGLVGELRAELDGTPRAQQVPLVWQIPPEMPPLHTDRTKLASVVRNLVNNALKFTERGSVTVRLACDPASGAHRIDVEDTGPGIPPEAMPYLFDRFYQVPGAHRSRGFGLGLFIVKRFTELLGGAVSVRSELGRGTCFSVTIPLRPQDSPAASA